MCGVKRERHRDYHPQVSIITTRMFSSISHLVGAGESYECMERGMGSCGRRQIDLWNNARFMGATRTPEMGNSRLSWRAVSITRRRLSSMSEADFHDIADDVLEGIHDEVEGALEDGFQGEFDCNISVSTGVATSRCAFLEYSTVQYTLRREA